MHLYPEKLNFTTKELIKNSFQKFSLPGTHCGIFFIIFLLFLGPFDICSGGSNCIEGICLCPAGKQPSRTNECVITNTTILIFNNKSKNSLLLKSNLPNNRNLTGECLYF